MTNFEYIVSQLDERKLADLFGESTEYRVKVKRAFKHWVDSLPYSKGNVLSPKNELDPNPFKWERVYNENIDNYQNYGRSFSVSFQDWLLSKFDPKQWK